MKKQFERLLVELKILLLVKSDHLSYSHTIIWLLGFLTFITMTFPLKVFKCQFRQIATVLAEFWCWCVNGIKTERCCRCGRFTGKVSLAIVHEKIALMCERGYCLPQCVYVSIRYICLTKQRKHPQVNNVPHGLALLRLYNWPLSYHGNFFPKSSSRWNRNSVHHNRETPACRSIWNVSLDFCSYE